MKTWSGTARRLFVSFSLLVLLFAIATYYSLEGLVDVHRKMHRIGNDYSLMAVSLGLEASAWQRYAHSEERRNGVSAPSRSDEAEVKWVELLLVELRKHGGAALRHTADEMERDLASLEPSFDSDDGALRTRAETAARVQERSRRIVKEFLPSVSDFEAHQDVTNHGSFRRALIFLVAAMALLLAVGFYIHRSIARPLKRLGEAAARLAAGNLAMRIHVDGPAEFGQLAEQLNEMTLALKRQQEELVRSERLAGIGRLAAGVAHEINNPLGVILGYARMLEHKDSDSAMAEDLRIIADEAMRCQEIVEGLIDVARPLKISGEPVFLRAICQEVVERLGQTMALPEGRIAIVGEGVARGSAPRLRQVLLNVVKNAVEAAGPGGHVSICIVGSPDGEFVVVSVKDSGAGIAPAVRDRLFEPFVSDKPSGTGLGLAVSQSIAEAHGGRMEIADAEGGGAIVSLWLPRIKEMG